jgi:hypothetical protein
MGREISPLVLIKQIQIRSLTLGCEPRFSVFKNWQEAMIAYTSGTRLRKDYKIRSMWGAVVPGEIRSGYIKPSLLPHFPLPQRTPSTFFSELNIAKRYEFSAWRLWKPKVLQRETMYACLFPATIYPNGTIDFDMEGPPSPGAGLSHKRKVLRHGTCFYSSV